MTAAGATEPILVGDIGGTKVSIGLAVAGDATSLQDVRVYPSGRYERLEDILAEDLASREPRPERAAFAVAGPVRAGAAQITNLPWTIDSAALRDGFDFADVALVNDLEALAWAVPELVESDLTTLQAGERDPAGAIAVVAPGTGLGEAFLTREGGAYVAHPSEGGHADFAPSDAVQARLLAYLQGEYAHVSWERVCSGSGLPAVHRFLLESEKMAEEPAVADRLATADDATPVIIAAALGGESPVCAQTVQIFVRVLAAEAGNLALKVLATGGVFLGGGLPARILPILEGPDFLDAFRAKGRFTELMARTPIHVVIDPHAVLRGAILCAAKRRVSEEAAR